MFSLKNKFRVMNDNISRIKRRIKYRGVKDTFLFYKNEFLFDFKRGIQTRYVISTEVMDVDKTEGSYMYTPVIEKAFIRLCRYLPNSVLDGEFIDIGSGKGRALILASEYGFKNIIGIEFSKSLCKIAEKNINNMKLKNIKVENINALNYKFNETGLLKPKVIYFYNPFNIEILQQVIKNINEFIDQTGVKIYILFVNPLSESIFPEDKYKIITFINEDTNNKAIIYESINL